MLFGEIAGFLCDLYDAFLVYVADHRDDESVWCVGGETDMEVFFECERFASGIKGGVECWKFFQCCGACFDKESQNSQFNAGSVLVGCGILFIDLYAQGLQLGDVGLIELGDVRDHRPIAGKIGTGNLLIRDKGWVSISPNLLKSTFGQGVS